MSEVSSDAGGICSRFYLDWRPVGALPTGAGQVVRPRDINRAALAAFINGVGQVKPSARLFEPFHWARVLARQDGLFVMRISVRKEGFDDADWEELATLVSACAKALLGHVHDVHDGPRSRGRGSGPLQPDAILVVEPIQLEDARWALPFSLNNFKDADLREACCVLPRDAPADDEPRNALVCLRRAHLRLFEDIVAVLDRHRESEVAETSFPHGVLNALAPILISVSATIALVSDWRALKESVFSGRTLQAAVVGGALMFIFILNLRKMLRFDLRRVRLLRASAAYFSYVNPLNRVIGRVLNTPAAQDTDDFSDLIRVLQIKVEGESHRTGVNQLWATLALAAYSVVMAALALPPRVEHQAPAPSQNYDAAIISPPARITTR